MTKILCGTSETIPMDVLQDVMSYARTAQERVVIVDEGSQLARGLFDPDRDVLIDPSRGNWDFFADYGSEYELACAGETMLRSKGVPTRAYNGASCILSGILWEEAGEPGAGLRTISDKIRGLGYATVADDLRLDLDRAEDTRVGWAALARLQEDAGRFAARCPTLPYVSLRRWIADPRGAVLFVTAGAAVLDGACRSVVTAVTRVVELEANAGEHISSFHYLAACEQNGLLVASSALGSC